MILLVSEVFLLQLLRRNREVGREREKGLEDGERTSPSTTEKWKVLDGLEDGA